MREEKKILVKEVLQHIGKSEYLYVVHFNRLTVADVAVLRRGLAKENAEYHVVKNSILRCSVKEAQLPALAKELTVGATAIVSGGESAPAVAKALTQFIGDPENENKLAIKGGFFMGRSISAETVLTLSKLPSLNVLRAQVLSLMQVSMRQLLTVFNATAQGFVRLLVAYQEKNQ
ncbi:MAG: 50S ribosomal protein L10 [Puniceicoccales bacterium]|jgi:large subunit ribosomal protein L10|nr:50S ribosomal protein L10 [Puniceicoccales bacterium]